MTWLRVLASRFMALFHKGCLEQELDEELRAHHEMLVQENLQRGMSPEDARCAALRSFGGVEQVKEIYREGRGLPLIETLFQDLRYGIRMLARNPGFTAVVVLTLGLGIGANTAIFSVVNAVLLRPLPYKHPERLVTFVAHVPGIGKMPWVDPHLFAELRQQSQMFEQIAAYDWSDTAITGRGDPEQVARVEATASGFPLLGLQPTLGRAFSAAEEQSGRNNVVLLSRNLWQRRFGSDPKLIGQTIRLDGRIFTVIGIMPGGLRLPAGGELWTPDLWTPMTLDLAAPMQHLAITVARRKEGVRLERIQGVVDVVVRRLNQQSRQQQPDVPPGPEATVRAVPLHEATVGDKRLALLVLLAAVGFVLLIACANVASLLLSRATVRQREIAIRTAVGASRARLIRQLLTESMLLALLGGGLGFALAMWGIHSLPALRPPSIPRIDEIGMDRWVLGFTFLVSTVTGILFGVAPALHVSRSDLNESLKEGSRTATGGRRRHRLRNLLVAGETALVLVLLVGAGLLIRSFIRLREVNLGFTAENVLTMELQLPELRYPSSTNRAVFQERLLTAMKSVPGVLAAGAGSPIPLAMQAYCGGVTVEGQPSSLANQRNDMFLCSIVSPGYFRAMGITLLEGRDFDQHDSETAPGVVIVSEAMARGFWPNQEPVGKRIKQGGPNSPWLSIAGVVADVRQEGLAAEPRPAFYMPYLQNSLLSMTVIVRTGSDPMSIAVAARRQVWALDKELPVQNIRTMGQIVSESLTEPRFHLVLLGTFAGLALLLATVGIYGVMSYFVTQRRHEIGIRMALGADRRQVLSLVVRRGLVTVLLGVGIGLAGALGLMRVMSSLLYAVQPTDPVTLVSVSILLTCVGVLASYIPARRATKVDPMVALRYE